MYLRKQILPDCRLEYRIENETVRITGNRLSPDDTEIIIPGRIGALPVTEIGEGAFKKCDWLISVTLPDSVKTIGESAFTGCSNLKEIRLPAELLKKAASGSLKNGPSTIITSTGTPTIITISADTGQAVP